jgi:hypothetical protein
MSRRRVLLGGLLGLYLLGLGYLVGIAVERMRFDGARATRLAELDTATSRLRGHLMLFEKHTRPAMASEAKR